jgi:3-phenylpropionate/trans-cinnamate dioxygenase ferredoxin reductase subunit
VSDEVELLVVGGGPAGLSAARAYRAARGRGAVAIVTDEHRMPYNRPPLTKDFLRGESSEDELPIEDEAWLAEQDVRLVSGRAVALDASERSASLSGGRELRYQSCVLATGAEPTRLPVPGADHPAVRVIRTLDHVRELTARLRTGDHVVVIGSGFIGCEIAASLRRRGQVVTLVSDESEPNVARLDTGPAERIHRWLDEEGVQLHLGAEVEEIAADGEDGSLEVRAGALRTRGRIVVMAAGVAPRGELAAATGVELSEDGAVPVDAAMRTSQDGLFAAGDVAFAKNATAGRRLRVEHWGDALGQGEVAGRAAAGQPAQWDAVPGFWSTIGSHTLKYAAWGDGFEESRLEDHGDGAFAAWYGRDGKIVGVLAHEADEDYERVRELIARGAPWS